MLSSSRGTEEVIEKGMNKKRYQKEEEREVGEKEERK